MSESKEKSSATAKQEAVEQKALEQNMSSQQLKELLDRYKAKLELVKDEAKKLTNEIHKIGPRIEEAEAIEREQTMDVKRKEFQDGKIQGKLWLTPTTYQPCTFLKEKEYSNNFYVLSGSDTVEIDANWFYVIGRSSDGKYFQFSF